MDQDILEYERDLECKNEEIEELKQQLEKKNQREL